MCKPKEGATWFPQLETSFQDSLPYEAGSEAGVTDRITKDRWMQESGETEHRGTTTHHGEFKTSVTKKGNGFFLIFFFLYYLLLLAALGVFRAARGLSLVVASGGFSLVVACRLLTAVDSLVAEHGL